MPFVPKGSISLPDLVEMGVAELYGQESIAEIDGVEDGVVTSFEVDGETLQQRSMYVVRAGIKISANEDGQRWDSVTELIRVALSKGELTADITTSSNQEWSIPKDYWKDEVPASLTVYGGALRSSPKPEFEDCSAYVEREEAQKWIAALNSAENRPAPTGKRGRPITKDYKKFEKTLEHHVTRLGDGWAALHPNTYLAEQTRKWMGNDPNVSNDEIPGQRMAETHIATMRLEGRVPPKK